MKSQPKVGTIGEIQFTVERLHAIDFADDQMPAVLSTPWLIWFLEHAAREAVLPSLQSGESTVGTHVDVRHLAPTPVGQCVTCQARVIHCEGPVVSLQMEARDEHELIARGVHKLRVIRCDRFSDRVRRKANR
jgi:fluoroacetyl-CoA thioesterase